MTNTPIQAVAFDLDGTMFNTETVYDQVTKVLLGRRNLVEDPSVVAKMMGRPSHIALKIMIDAYQLPDGVEELQRESKQLFLEIAADQAAPMPGLMELLDALDGAGIPKSITTSSHRSMMQPLLIAAGIHERFAFELTSEDVTNHKPDPEIYLTAARRFEIDAANLLVLEDSQVGCQAAVAAGAVTIVVPSKLADHQVFEQAFRIASGLSDPIIYQRLGIRSKH